MPSPTAAAEKSNQTLKTLGSTELTDATAVVDEYLGYAERLASFTHGHERADFAAVRNAASLQRCGKVVVSAEGGAW